MPTVKINEQQKEWAVKIAVGLATILFCYWVMIQPVFQDITNMHRSIVDVKRRSELYREVRALKKSLDDGERPLATLTERSQLLGKVSDIVGRNQLRVETLTPRTAPDGAYTKLKMEMVGRGNFFSLVKFLQAIEKSGTEIKVRDISILWKPFSDPQKNRYPLQIQIVFETLLKQQIRKNNV